jgi:DNA-binding NarL/FixJ family response regulator
MKNWNSKKKEYTDIIKMDTREKAQLAQFLKLQGMSVKDIAEKLELSESRIKEYLKDE